MESLQDKLRDDIQKLREINILLNKKEEKIYTYMKLLQDMLDDAVRRYNIIATNLQK